MLRLGSTTISVPVPPFCVITAVSALVPPRPGLEPGTTGFQLPAFDHWKSTPPVHVPTAASAEDGDDTTPAAPAAEIAANAAARSEYLTLLLLSSPKRMPASWRTLVKLGMI